MQTLKNSTEVTVLELGIRKGRNSEVLYSYEYDSRKHTLQQEGKSPSHLWDWSIKNSGRLLFGKEKQKEAFERYKIMTSAECIALYKPLVCDFKIKKWKTLAVCTQKNDMETISRVQRVIPGH